MSLKHSLLAMLVVVIWGANFVVIDAGQADIPPLLHLALALGMPPGLASLLLQTQVIFSILIAAVALRERPTRRQLLGAFIGMVGLSIVIAGHSQVAPWLPLVVDTPAVVWEALSGISWVAIASTVYTAVFASLIGYGIWTSLLARYPTSAVVPFTLLVPVVGILTAWIVQGEVPTTLEFVGGAIMLCGLAAAVIQPSRRNAGAFVPSGSQVMSKEKLT